VLLEGRCTETAGVVKPEYKIGQVWEDATGMLYMYDLFASGGCWLTFGDDDAHSFSRPVRPLKLIKDV
jgi:hypothetical protein